MKYKLELTSFLGIFASIYVFSIILDGKEKMFWDFPSFLIVVVGTLLITLSSSPIRECLKNLSLIINISIKTPISPNQLSERMISITQKLYKKQYENFHNDMKSEKDIPFFYKNLKMILDNEKTQNIIKSMEVEMIAWNQQYESAASMLKRIAEIAPAMGLVGTLIGLVEMLYHVNDISLLGKSMSLALLTTFYGSIIAYIIVFPLISRIEIIAQKHLLNMRICEATIINACNKNHPYYLQTHLDDLLLNQKI